MLLESFGSTAKLLTALFVEFSVFYFICIGICCSEMSCSEENHNKAVASFIGYFLLDLHYLSLPVDRPHSKLFTTGSKFIIKSTQVFINHLKENKSQ